MPKLHLRAQTGDLFMLCVFIRLRNTYIVRYSSIPTYNFFLKDAATTSQLKGLQHYQSTRGKKSHIFPVFSLGFYVSYKDLYEA